MEAQIDKNKPTGSFSMYVEIMGCNSTSLPHHPLVKLTQTGSERSSNQISSVDGRCGPKG